MAKVKQEWKMPAWMEPYRDLFRNTGGNSIEEMVNDETDSFINLPRAVLAVAVKSQVSFLYAMHERSMLAKIVKPAPEVRRTVSGWRPQNEGD